MERQSLIFYHLLPEDANITEYGIVTPEFYYRNGQFKEYKKVTDKYRDRLVYDWQIYPNIYPEEITIKQMYDGLNYFRGDKNGNNRIYCFRYLPYKALGRNMESILNGKRAIQIDILDGLTKRYIDSIDWGYWMSDSRNRALHRTYYQNVTKEEYFHYYNDNAQPIFSTLNHIAIIPKLCYLPKILLTEVDIK